MNLQAQRDTWLAVQQRAKQILATAQAELRFEGIPFDQAMEVGIMVEVPAAVAMAARALLQPDSAEAVREYVTRQMGNRV